MPAETVLDRRVGTDVLAVSIAGQTIPDGSTGPVVIHHGREDATRQPDAATATLRVDRAALAALPTIGDPVVIDLGADAVAAFGLAGAEMVAARRRFTGTVAAAAVVPDARRRTVVAVTAVSRRAQLGRVLVGSAPWPAESGGTRAARLLQLSGTVPIIDVDGSDYDPTNADGWRWSYTTGSPAPTLSHDTGEPTILRIDWAAGNGNKVVGRWLGDPAHGMPALIAGETYTAVAEVLVTGAYVQIDAAFVGRGRPVYPSPDWQIVTHTWTEPVGTSGFRYVGVGPADGIPEQSDDWQTVTRPAGTWAKLRRMTVWRSEIGPVSLLKAGQIDPTAVQVRARDVDRQTALTLVEQLAESTGSVLAELRDGTLEWQDSEHRRNVAQLVQLAADDVLAGVPWRLDVVGLVNDLTVFYGPNPVSGERTSVRVVDPQSANPATGIGTLANRLDSELENAADATSLAQLAVARYGRPAWRTEQLDVDLLRTVDQATARLLLTAEFGALLTVTGFPSGGPFTSRRLFVEGWTETITRDGWRWQPAVSDYGLTGAPVRWADVPGAITWATIDPTLTWFGLAAVDFGQADTVDRWLDIPADLRWTEVDPAETWATWPP